MMMIIYMINRNNQITNKAFGYFCLYYIVNRLISESYYGRYTLSNISYNIIKKIYSVILLIITIKSVDPLTNDILTYNALLLIKYRNIAKKYQCDHIKQYIAVIYKLIRKVNINLALFNNLKIIPIHMNKHVNVLFELYPHNIIQMLLEIQIHLSEMFLNQIKN